MFKDLMTIVKANTCKLKDACGSFINCFACMDYYHHNKVFSPKPHTQVPGPMFVYPRKDKKMIEKQLQFEFMKEPIPFRGVCIHFDGGVCSHPIVNAGEVGTDCCNKCASFENQKEN
jgi:hypothetical protein